MGLSHIRRATGLGVAAGLLVGAAVGTAMADSGKPVKPVQVDATRIQENVRRSVDFVRNFATHGGNPRALPRAKMMTYSRGPASLSEAVASAELIVAGRVLETTFESRNTGGTPDAVSKIDVNSTLKGAPQSQLTLIQGGGPQMTSSGPVLFEDDTGDLVLPDDDVVLFLVRHPDRDAYLAIPAAGIYFVDGTRLAPLASNRFGGEWRGRQVAELVIAVRAHPR